jgi:ligand-binding sensor domain-containing protein
MQRRAALALLAAPALRAEATPALRDGATPTFQDGATPTLRVKDAYEVGPAVYVRALTVEARRAALWVGTSAGVHEVDLASGRLRGTFTRQHGLANEYVFAVGLDRRGRKWFGTNAGGVSRYQDGRWKTFFPMHGLADYWVYAFAEQRNGDFWIGTWAGANKVDARTGRFTTYVKQLVNEWVYGIAVDRRDRVWFGTEGGVSRFDGRTWRAWTHADGLGAPNHDQLPFSANTGLGTRTRHDLSVGAEGRATYNPSYVFAVHAAPDGSVWAGTWGGGVARFDGSAWTNLTVQQGLAGNIVYSIAQAADGVLWFGTSNGISRWDGRSFVNLGVADGLLDHHVYAIAVAPDGDVWVGTRRGVARIAS